MTKAELKAYIRTHHEDDEAIRELFDRSNGKRVVCSMPEDFEKIMANFEKGILP